MPYEVVYLEELGIVLIKNIGELTYENFSKQSREAIELGRMKKAELFLSDCTKLIASASTIELYDFPEMYERLGMTRSSKIAVLISTDTAGDRDLLFYETVCRNRGWQIKVFTIKQSAMEWLLRK